jgi:hypothetical protein
MDALFPYSLAVGIRAVVESILFDCEKDQLYDIEHERGVKL